MICDYCNNNKTTVAFCTKILDKISKKQRYVNVCIDCIPHHINKCDKYHATLISKRKKLMRYIIKSNL